MPCQIVVSYQSGVPTGEIVAIVDDLHQWTANETLSEWVALDPVNNGRDNWHRRFTLVKVTDKNKDELEHLLEPLMLLGAAEPTPHPSGLKRWYFGVPQLGEPAYDSLNQTGEIVCDFAFASTYLRERV